MTPEDFIKDQAWKWPVAQSPNREPQPMQFNLKMAFEMLPALLRIRRWSREQRKKGRRPIVDLLNSGFQIEPNLGVPLGGLGGGTITRGCRGDFNRWQLKPGDYGYHAVAADQFSLWVSREGEKPAAVVLNPGITDEGLQSWRWQLDESRITYRALFPRAWHDYEAPLPGINLSCRQISPVIPHNYKESSTPAGTFVWTIENTGQTAVDVALMFTFQNGTGDENDLRGGHSNHLHTESTGEGEVVGVQMNHLLRHPKPVAEDDSGESPEIFEDPLAFGIAALARDGVTVSYRTRFITGSSGMDIWGDFADNGRLSNDADDRPSPEGFAIGAGVSARVHVPAGETRQIIFALVWDMPIARFPLGTGWYRRYTAFYGREGEAVPDLLRDALLNYPAWEKAIDAWQAPILSNEDLPLWYRRMLFNETYYLVDGGTLWTAGKAGPVDAEDILPEPDIGHFAYLESHEYRMCNTYDVHFYASFALAMLWPELELSLQRDYARSLEVVDDETFTYFFSGDKGPRKVKNAIPHDLGSPLEDPWRKINAYNAQDVSRWKDLNPKFVLQVARDFFLTRDEAFLRLVWPAVQQAIDFMGQFDRDGDGMIENEGFPDQTYDVWSATGPSAYCGGLWLACLQAGAALAEVMREPNQAASYRKILEKAQAVYEDQLWNGEYYQYEASGSKHQDSVMADQLAGHWYSLACGLGGIVPAEHAQSALRKVFELNVMGYESGWLGAVNGMRPNGSLDKTGMQSMEIWTGTTFAVAAAMLQAGLSEEAFTTAMGVFNMIYEEYGLWFQTPEALSVTGNVRAIAYMRPLSIWAIQWELEGRLRE